MIVLMNNLTEASLSKKPTGQANQKHGNDDRRISKVAHNIHHFSIALTPTTVGWRLFAVTLVIVVVGIRIVGW
jgi:hypothetical protein